MNTSVANLLRFLGCSPRPAAGRRTRRADGARRKSPTSPMTLDSLELRQFLNGAPIVAVIDTGLTTTDPTIHAHLWTNPNENTTIIGDNDGNGYQNDINGANILDGLGDITDPTGHGTAVAETVLSAAAAVGATDVQIMPVEAITAFAPPVGGTSVSGGTWVAPTVAGGNGTFIQSNFQNGDVWTWVGPGNANGPTVGNGTWTWSGTGPAPVTTTYQTPPANTPGAGDWIFGGGTVTYTANNATYTFANGRYTSAQDARWTWIASGTPTLPLTIATSGTWTYKSTGPGPGLFRAGAAGTPNEGPGNGTFTSTAGVWAWTEPLPPGTNTFSNTMGTPSTADTLALAINYVVTEKVSFGQNVVAMTLSIGGFLSNVPNADISLVNLRAAIQRAGNAGILMVLGAGNGGNNNDLVPNYPANFGMTLLVPVAATDANGNLAGFSNFGFATVPFAAVGVGLPVTTAPGSGSEFAAAQIAGVVAGYNSLYGTSPSNAIIAINKSVTPSASLAGMVTTGGYLSTADIATVGAFLNNRPPVAVIESATQSAVTGYAYDLDAGANPSLVNVVIDGVTVASNVPANGVQDVPLSNGNHGFSIGYPTLTPGTHVIQIFVQDFPTGIFAAVARQTITVNLPLMAITLAGAPVANNQVINYGNVFQSGIVIDIFTVNNLGNQPLTISTLSIPAGYTLTKDISHTLNPGQSDTFDVQINSANTGTISGPLSFATNDVANSAFTLNLTGNVSASFVNNLYTTLLGRPADAAGLSYWTQQIISLRMTTAQVAAAFLNTTEYRTDQIQGLYTSLLGRPADSSGLNYWLGVFANGGTIEEIRNAFLSSGEYFMLQDFNTNNLVSSYYIVLFNRVVDPAGLSFWSNEIITGTPSSTVVTQLQNSPEGENSTVQRLYLSLLDRNADSAGITYWSSKLAAGLGEIGLSADLLNSTEFFLQP